MFVNRPRLASRSSAFRQFRRTINGQLRVIRLDVSMRMLQSGNHADIGESTRARDHSAPSRPILVRPGWGKSCSNRSQNVAMSSRRERCCWMSDRSLTCRDCSQEFVFTLGEQEFYQQRGFSEPQRCPNCRQARKSQRDGGGGGGGYASGGSSSGGFGGGSGYGSAPRQLFPATCSECGQQTEVPFNPTAGKPVYCRECFSSRKAAPRFDAW